MKNDILKIEKEFYERKAEDIAISIVRKERYAVYRQRL